MNPTPEQLAKLPKWAQSHIESLQMRVTHLEGLPETIDLIAPDLPPPTCGESGMRLTRGWDFNLYALKDRMGGVYSAVYKACSSAIHNGTDWKETRSQGTRHLYSTERKAWLAAKAAFLKWASETLAEVDEGIVKASDEPYHE